MTVILYVVFLSLAFLFIYVYLREDADISPPWGCSASSHKAWPGSCRRKQSCDLRLHGHTFHLSFHASCGRDRSISRTYIYRNKSNINLYLRSLAVESWSKSAPWWPHPFELSPLAFAVEIQTLSELPVRINLKAKWWHTWTSLNSSWKGSHPQLSSAPNSTRLHPQRFVVWSLMLHDICRAVRLFYKQNKKKNKKERMFPN